MKEDTVIDDYEKEISKLIDNASRMRVMAIFFVIIIFLLSAVIFLTLSTRRITIFDSKEQEFDLAVVKNNSESLILSPEGQGLSPGEKALIVLLVKKNKDGGESFRLEWKMPDEKPSD